VRRLIKKMQKLNKVQMRKILNMVLQTTSKKKKLMKKLEVAVFPTMHKNRLF
jgi:hypothetical protein